MTENYLHDVNVIEVTSGTRTIHAAKTSVIGLQLVQQPLSMTTFFL